MLSIAGIRKAWFVADTLSILGGLVLVYAVFKGAPLNSIEVGIILMAIPVLFDIFLIRSIATFIAMMQEVRKWKFTPYPILVGVLGMPIGHVSRLLVKASDLNLYPMNTFEITMSYVEVMLLIVCLGYEIYLLKRSF